MCCCGEYKYLSAATVCGSMILTLFVYGLVLATVVETTLRHYERRIVLKGHHPYVVFMLKILSPIGASMDSFLSNQLQKFVAFADSKQWVERIKSD